MRYSPVAPILIYSFLLMAGFGNSYHVIPQRHLEDSGIKIWLVLLESSYVACIMKRLDRDEDPRIETFGLLLSLCYVRAQ